MINVAVVGCGYWGPNLIRNFHSLPDCCIKVICDFDRQRLDYLKKSYPAVTTTTDCTEVIGDPEVNAVATVGYVLEAIGRLLGAGQARISKESEADSAAAR